MGKAGRASRAKSDEKPRTAMLSTGSSRDKGAEKKVPGRRAQV